MDANKMLTIQKIFRLPAETLVLGGKYRKASDERIAEISKELDEELKNIIPERCFDDEADRNAFSAICRGARVLLSGCVFGKQKISEDDKEAADQLATNWQKSLDEVRKRFDDFKTVKELAAEKEFKKIKSPLNKKVEAQTVVQKTETSGGTDSSKVDVPVRKDTCEYAVSADGFTDADDEVIDIFT